LGSTFREPRRRQCEQGAEQHEQADESKLQISGANLFVDVGAQSGFVDADDQAGLRAGNACEADGAPGMIGSGK